MKYNFKILVPLSEDENEAINEAVAGLKTEGTLAITAQISTNTELPDDLVKALGDNVSDLLSDKLGSDVEAELVSSEY